MRQVTYTDDSILRGFAGGDREHAVATTRHAPGSGRGGEVLVSGRALERLARDRTPAQLVHYAQAFLRTERDGVRFLWRDQDTWFAVKLERRVRGEPRRDDAVLEYTEVELPGGVTSREIDILTLLSLGLTNGQVADRLGTSARTVSTQVERLLGKLEQSGRAGLAALAVDAGMLRLPVPGGTTGLAAIGPVEVEQMSQTGPGQPGPRQPHDRVALPGRRPYLLGTAAVRCEGSTLDAVEVRRGSALAVEELNARGGVGGRRVEHVVVEMDLFEAESVRRGMERLFEQDVDAVTTSYLSAENPFVLDLAADHGKPFLHTATFEEQVDVVRDNPARYGAIFQTCPSETYYGTGMIRLLDDLESRSTWQPRSRRIVSIEVDAQSTHTTNSAFLDRAARSGWELAELIRVPPGKRDWSDVLARVEVLDPEVIMVTHFVTEDIVALQRALHELASGALVYHVYGASVPHFRDRAREAAEGVVWSTVTGLYDDPLGREFRSRYRRRFGTEAGWSMASAAYDQVRLLGSAWAATGSRDPGEVADYLRQTAYRGLNGVYYLGSPGQASLSYPDTTPDPSIGQAQMVYQFQQGEPRVLGPEPHGTAEAFVVPAGHR